MGAYPLRNSAAIVERITIAKMLSTMQHLAIRRCQYLSAIIGRWWNAERTEGKGENDRPGGAPVMRFCYISICGKKPYYCHLRREHWFHGQAGVAGEREGCGGRGGRESNEVKLLGCDAPACLCQGVAAYIYISHMVTHSHL